MPIEIRLTAGPNVIGLPEDRTTFYIGYSYRGNNLVWRVLEGKKDNNPASYKLHIGNHGTKLLEAKITHFEKAKKDITIKFLLQTEEGTLSIARGNSKSRYTHGLIDEIIETEYNSI